VDLRAEAMAMMDELVRWRRHLHRHPELAYAERATLEYLEAELRSLGFAPRRVAGGLVADVDGASAGARVAVRADMDGLPLVEQSGEPFASENHGVMHACGHDAHMACALGAARLVMAHRSELAGSVRFIFQPAEEKVPGGALGLIRDGALFGVDGIVGLHVMASAPVGKVQLNRGTLMANADMFHVNVNGVGGHGSRPHETVDAVLVAARMVEHIQGIVSRRVDPLWPVVVTVGQFHAGTAPNIISAHAELGGTVRTYTEEARQRVKAELRRVVEGVARLEGGSAELDYQDGYPAVVNPEHGITDVVWREAEAVVGEGAVFEAAPDPGAEDYAYYMREVPGVFMFLGCGGPGSPPHHSPQFRVDEDCLPLGAAILAGSALRLAKDGVPAART
jgi:amidohydrolase